MSACARVLAIPELLEMILLNLPPKDTLLSQRVCSTFKTAITSSVQLQRHLFFRREPSSASTDLDRLVRRSTTSTSTNHNYLILSEYDHSDEYYDCMIHVPGIKLDIFGIDEGGISLRIFDHNMSQVQTFVASDASCLDMYLQHADDDIELSVFHEHSLTDYHTKVILRATTLRNLLRIALALSGTAEALTWYERQHREKKWRKKEEQMGEEGDVSRVEDVGAVWKEKLEAEFPDMVVGEPKVERD